MTEPPIVVYHVAAMGDWQDVVPEQLRLLVAAGLTRDVRITHVGQGADWVMDECRRRGIDAVLVRSDPNLLHYETFAMFEIERLAKEEMTARPILYMHTKGVSAPHLHAKRLWRRLMEHYVVRLWRENLAMLANGKDAVGVNWCSWSDPHFAGTFWIVKPDWIRKLRPFAVWHNQRNRERYSCELWIGTTPGINPHSYVCVDEYWGHDRESDFRDRLRAAAPDLEPVTVTWVSGASRGYERDLARLAGSLDRLGPGHRFALNRLDAGRPFRHTVKFDLLDAAARTCDTSHLFWIDADCEIAEPFAPAAVVDVTRPLAAVRHFGSDDVRTWLPPHLRERITWPIPNVSWQSCLYGGRTADVVDQIRRLAWMGRENHHYDEHGLVMDWSARPDEVHTLPCRFAAPTSFGPFPEYERTYHERAGGPPLVLHHNRNLCR